MADLVVVHGRRRGHHGMEGGPVAVRGPDLEAVFRRRSERLGVLDEGGDPHRRVHGADRIEFRVHRVHEELQRGQTLLTVDDDPLLHEAGVPRNLL